MVWEIDDLFDIKIPPQTASLAAQRRYKYIRSLCNSGMQTLYRSGETLSSTKQLPVLAALDAKGLTL
jgi:hypothetical protein